MGTPASSSHLDQIQDMVAMFYHSKTYSYNPSEWKKKQKKRWNAWSHDHLEKHAAVVDFLGKNMLLT